MRNICPNCLTIVNEKEIKAGYCHCGYNIKDPEDLLTAEEAITEHDRMNKYRIDNPYMDNLETIKNDIHFIVNLIKVCIVLEVIAAILFIVAFTL